MIVPLLVVSQARAQEVPPPAPAEVPPPALTDESGPAEITPPMAAEPPPPSASLDGSVLTLTLAGSQYALSNNAVFPGRSVELHFEQPYDQGYNQLWIMVGKVKKGVPTAIDGFGLGTAFVQIQPDTAVESSTRNVSGFCSTKGTVTFDEKPKAGATASGAVDLTITCRDVPELGAPLVLQGTFSGLPVRQP